MVKHMFAGNPTGATFGNRLSPLQGYGRSTSKPKRSIGKIITEQKNSDSQIGCDNQCDNPYKTPDNSTENLKIKVLPIGLMDFQAEYFYRTNKISYIQIDYINLELPIELSNKPIAKIGSKSQTENWQNRGIKSIGIISDRGGNTAIAIKRRIEIMALTKRGRGRPKSAEKSTTVWVGITTSRRLKEYVEVQGHRQQAEGKPAPKQTAEGGIKELLDLATVCQQVWGNVSIQSVMEQLKKTIEKTREQKVKEDNLDRFIEEA